MSFSFRVKKELARIEPGERHCDIAEITAMINLMGQIKNLDNIDDASLQLQTENPNVAKKYFVLVKKTFDINSEIIIKKNKQLRGKTLYRTLVRGKENILTILRTCELVDEKARPSYRISKQIIRDEACKRAYLRGAFMAVGSMSKPEKTYHLEFVTKDEHGAKELLMLLKYFRLRGMLIDRKGYSVVYIKDSESIVDLLNIMGAHNSLMEMENIRILKELRNDVNRKLNCEMANINKTVKASNRQIADIKYIEENIGLDSLNEVLRETANLRVKYYYASLSELGKMFKEPVGRSGVNHRLRKISKIADDLREKKEQRGQDKE